jgi:class 3 adenylate cyclase
MPVAPASAIARSLAHVREDTEREIAKHRIRLYAFSVVLTAVIKLSGVPGLSWTPSLMLTVGTLIALGQQAFSRRFGARSWAIVLGSSVDLLLVAGIFILSQPPAPDPVATREWLNVHAVALTCILTIATLRLSVRSATLTTLAASATYLLTACWLVGPHPAFFVAAGLMLFMIWFARTVIRRTERNLELFARYQQLRRYLPATAVERVLNENLDDALAVGGRSVEVTLLSSDLRGFTALSEKLAPEEVVQQLNAYHGTMLEEIDRFGGSLDKFMGDGALVVFGLPEGGSPRPDAGAQAAVDCAVAMLRALERLNAERVKAALEPLKMGLGVHTGVVVAGNIGAPGRRLEFTVIGDAVNTAARLEGATKELGVPLAISQHTVERLGAGHRLVPLAPVWLRGKEGSLQVFTVAATSDAAEGGHAQPSR